MVKPVGRFVRLPTNILEALWTTPLTGIQLRIVLWTIRQTIGWHREWTRFSWYGIAKALRADRAAVYRAGQHLIAARILVCKDMRLSIQPDPHLWHHRSRSQKNAKPLSRDTQTDATEQRVRSPGTTLFRGVKESCEERCKEQRQ